MKFGQEVVGLSDVAMEVLNFRYLKGGETPEDMFKRVASLVASVEEFPKRWRKKFYRLMASLDFLPNTPTLINAGKDKGQLAACFVLPVEDSIPEIFDTLKQMAIIQKGGGGTGFSFSRLRPEGSLVEETGGIASGPVSFMRVFNAATGEMKQGGTRRGANMGVLRVDHPDIMKFVKCKRVEGSFSNFNISVGITDEFMRCLSRDKPFTLRWESKTGNHGTEKEVDPKEIWNEIIKGAWTNGEPGVVFLDRVNDTNYIPGEIIEGTNPCGEQPLPPYGVCNLGSINLSNFVTDGFFDFERLKLVIPVAVRFLDNIIDVNYYPLEEIQREAFKTRRIGLGIMGLADAFIKMEMAYGSEESITFAENVMECIQEDSWEASQELGKEKGVPGFLAHKLIKRRNGALTTIAPTGSLSLIAGCSSGCEPVFSFHYEKKCIDSTVTLYHPLYEEYLKGEKGVDGFHYPPPIPGYLITAKEVPIREHILIQAALQKYIDSGVSKTINAGNSTTIDQVSDAFELAYKSGCKSISFYREGSRTIEGHTDKSSVEKTTEDIDQILPISKNADMDKDKTDLARPNRLNGFTTKIKTGRGTLYITVNDLNGKPFEVFLKIGKSGRSDFANSEALGRIISLALRSGVSVKKIIKHLNDISGDSTVWDYGQDVKSVPDAVAIVLRSEYLETEGTESDTELPPKKDHGLVCPDCESTNMELESGCILCRDCGWSRC